MIVFAPVMFALLWLVMVVQEFLAPLTLKVSGGMVQTFFVLPWVFFYALALAVPYPLMLFFAVAAGIMWDARWQVVIETPDFPFGTTVVLFTLLGSFVQGIRPLFRRGNWFLPVVMIGLAVFFQLGFEYLLISFQRGGFQFSTELWFTMVFTSVAAMVISPVFLFLISRIAKKTGYQLEFEQFTFRRSYGHQI